MLCVRVWCANGEVCLAGSVVRRSPASVQQLSCVTGTTRFPFALPCLFVCVSIVTVVAALTVSVLLCSDYPYLSLRSALLRSFCPSSAYLVPFWEESDNMVRPYLSLGLCFVDIPENVSLILRMCDQPQTKRRFADDDPESDEEPVYRGSHGKQLRHMGKQFGGPAMTTRTRKTNVPAEEQQFRGAGGKQLHRLRPNESEDDDDDRGGGGGG